MLCERACRPRAVDVDTALATCSFLAMHVLHNDRVSNRFDVVGFYDFELVREQAGRRVHKFTATKDHGFGNPNIFRIAAGGRAGRSRSGPDATGVPGQRRAPRPRRAPPPARQAAHMC
ncbi:MAG: hypothetical protein JSR49_11910 [Proteobacteria bacterium]|jgi:hypothetical protein|nr:hypothetical protein [Pseudomonadota bacterium]